MFDIKDKAVLVTGGGSGIGLACVERFVEAGAKVVIADFQDVSDKARAMGAHYIPVDVSDEAEVKAMYEQAVATLGPLDAVLLNAGIVGRDDGVFIEDGSADAMQQLFSVNCFGMFYGLKHGVGHMRDGGSFVLTSSLAAKYTVPGTSQYTATKHAAVGLVKVAALEFGERGIRVNAVCPGYVKTPGMDDSAELFDMIEEVQAIGRPLETDDLVGLYHFLASDESCMISGQALDVDGAKTAGVTPKFLRRFDPRMK